MDIFRGCFIRRSLIFKAILRNLSKWIHIKFYILSSGRVKDQWPKSIAVHVNNRLLKDFLLIKSIIHMVIGVL